MVLNFGEMNELPVQNNLLAIEQSDSINQDFSRSSPRQRMQMRSLS